MKRFLLAAFLPAILFACNPQKQAIKGTWVINKIETPEATVMGDEMPTSSFEFKKKGKMKANRNGVRQDMTWEVRNDSLITADENGIEAYRILSISEDDITVVSIQGDAKLKIFLKREE